MSTAYVPIQSNSIYDQMGKVYNVSKVINKKDGFTFDEDKYEAYSEVSDDSAMNKNALCIIL